MKKIILYLTLVLASTVFSCKEHPQNNKELAVNNNKTQKSRDIWSKEKASDWYQEQPWLVGANFSPSTAINQLEMWQEESFDPETIDKELGWAEDLGMNTMRVYLHDLLHKNDPQGLYNRMDEFLIMADSHGIKTLFVLFDSCWDPFPKAGEQREPKPHVHNSGWVQSPGQEVLQDSTQYERLEKYVKETVGQFRTDDRILGWDIWNEPDNMTGPSYEDVEIPNKAELVMLLMEKAFAWARSANPTQPLTSGVWIGDWSDPEKMEPMHKMQLELSDVITFHNYSKPADFEKNIKELQHYGKPILCTEYMARPNGSTFEGFLPIARKYNVGMYNWGFVDGKTQTKYPWDSWTKTYTSAPEVWFHEIFRKNGEPYKKEETQFISKLTSKVNDH